MAWWKKPTTVMSFESTFCIALPVTVTEEQVGLALAIIKEVSRITSGIVPLHTGGEFSKQGITTGKTLF